VIVAEFLGAWLLAGVVTIISLKAIKAAVARRAS
jgi:hypothetical protein